MGLAREILSLLDRIAIVPRRMTLAAAGVRVTVPMLRNVWGTALRGLDPAAFRAVFEGAPGPGGTVPRYVLRPAPAKSAGGPALEWILVGDAIRHDASLWRAWDVASGIGLGPDRRRFHIRACRFLGPGGGVATNLVKGGWPLGGARWPLDGDPSAAPCRIRFHAPLRILRGHFLLLRPTFPNLVVAATHRVSTLLDPEGRNTLRRLLRRIIDYSRLRPFGPWDGRRFMLDSPSTKPSRKPELQGVVGVLDLPEGPGETWPLFAAARWLHIGGGTAVGMGQPLLQPLKPG